MQKILRFFGEPVILPEEDYKTILFTSTDDVLIDEPQNDLETHSTSKPIVQHRVGKITQLGPNSGIIDDKYFFQKNDLMQKDVTCGQMVRFIALKSGENVDWKITQVCILNEQDDWELNDNVKLIRENVTLDQTIVTRIIEKTGRILYAGTEKNLKLDLDKVNCQFSPMCGDVVALTITVEMKNDGTPRDQLNIVEIKSLKAVRIHRYEGLITHLSLDDYNDVIGIIGNKVYFTATACDNGYRPKIGDTVLANVIESQQGELTKRAIRVVEFVSNEGEETLVSKIEKERLFDSKNGITVDSICEKSFLKLGEKTKFEILVENSSNVEQKIINIELKNSKMNSTMKIYEEENLEYPIAIPAGHSFSMHVEAKANNSGTYTDILILSFEGDWHVAKILEIEGDIDETICNKFSRPRYNDNVRKSTQARRMENMRKTLPTALGFIRRGNRPTKPAPFIPVKIGLFYVPDSIKEIVIGDAETLKSNSDIQNELQGLFPTMIDELNPDNYLTKLHNLLHLEDLEASITIKKYDKDRVHFEKSGKYLILEIPNLAESRPSLIIGDSLEATDPTITDPGKIERLEGCIHKVLKNAIKLCFTDSFHENYDGRDYSVTFKHNRTPICRFHTVINVVMKNMGSEWLFPNVIGHLKRPQVNVVGEYPLPLPNPVESHVCSVTKESLKIENKNSICRKNKISNKSVSAVLSDLDSDSDSENIPIELEEEPNWRPSVYSDVATPHDYTMLARPFGEKRIDWVDGDRRKNRKLILENTSEKPTRLNKISPKVQDVTIKWINSNLNYYQKEAVKNILKGVARPLPYVIFGPPGTGKTVTVVETILQVTYLIPDSRILVAAPSNSSADLICERLIDWGMLKPGDLVRLVGYNYMIEDRMPEKLKQFCTCLDMKKSEGKDVSYDEEGVKFSTRESLGLHRITISTCSSAGSLYAMGFPKNHFTHIIVDEAGQATEPEVMVPFAFLSQDGQAILAGDPLQLGPVITSKVAAAMGLGESFLSRLLIRFPYHRDPESYPDTDGYDPRLVTRLLYNYRSLPEILNLYSSLFYESKLIATICGVCSTERKLLEQAVDVQDRPNHDVQEIIVHGIKGRNVQDEDSPSWYNEHEIALVLRYVAGLRSCGINTENIGIITPYQKQVMKIREVLRSIMNDIPKVGTVEEFQGQERMVIILSTVRSDVGLLDKDRKFALGFVASKQRVNVAISRAKALLIIIGNPHLLCSDSTWRNLLRICYSRGYYTGCDLPDFVTE